MIDFPAMARARAGKRWAKADDIERRRLIALEKVEWLRAELGPADHDQAYGDWLKAQPMNVQDAALGRARAEAWREGRIEIDRFIAPPGALTREQLAARAPQEDE